LITNPSTQQINKTMKNKRAIDEMTKLARPLMKYLNESYSPYAKIIITPTSVEYSETIASNPKIMDYVKD